jgi:hypothetical protein
MGRGWLAVAAGALLAAPGASRTADEVSRLAAAPDTAPRIELHTLLFPREPPARLLRARLTIQGIDPQDVARTVEAYNRRSRIVNFSASGMAVAPFLLGDVFRLDPGQSLAFRWTGQTAKLVFQFSWR